MSSQPLQQDAALTEILRHISEGAIPAERRRALAQHWESLREDHHDAAPDRPPEEVDLFRDLIFGPSALSAARATNATIAGDEHSLVHALESQGQLRSYIKQAIAEGTSLDSLVESTKNLAELSITSDPDNDLNKVVAASLVNHWLALEVAESLPPLPDGGYLRRTEEWRQHVGLQKSALSGFIFNAIHAANAATINDIVNEFFDRYKGQGITKAEIRSEAFHVFQSTLFRYDPTKGANFNTYLTMRLRKGLARAINPLLGDGEVSADSTGKDGDDLSILNTLSHNRELNPQTNAIRRESAAQLRGTIRDLPDISRIILQLSRGFVDEDGQALIQEQYGVLLDRDRCRHPHTLHEIGQIIGKPSWKTGEYMRRAMRELGGILNMDQPATTQEPKPRTPHAFNDLSTITGKVSRGPLPTSDAIIPSSDSTVYGGRDTSAPHPSSPIMLDSSHSFGECLDSYVAKKGNDVHEFLRLYMKARGFGVMELRDEINGAKGVNEPIGIDMIRTWVRENGPIKINATCRDHLCRRYGMNPQQKTKLELINHTVPTLELPEQIVTDAEAVLAQAETKYKEAITRAQQQLLKFCKNDTGKLAQLLSVAVKDPYIETVLREEKTALATIEATRKKVAFNTYGKLLAASGLNAEQLPKRLDGNIAGSTLRLWQKDKVIGFDTMAPVADRMADVFIPHKETENVETPDEDKLARRAANIMAGLPWSKPRGFKERMQYAVDHKLSAVDFLDMFRHQERTRVYQRLGRDPQTIYRAFLSEGPPAMEITTAQLAGFKRRQDAPNTAIINHVAGRIGAVDPEDFAAFRKLVFQYPMQAGQKEVDDSLIALESAGKDKTQRAAAFDRLEQALIYRDGLRPKGFRGELCEAIYAHAQTQNLLPPDSGITPENLSNGIGTLIKKGGETSMLKAKIIAAYAFPPEMQERGVAVFSPNRFQEKEPGKGNLFLEGEKPFRPGWTFNSPPRRKIAKGAAAEEQERS